MSNNIHISLEVIESICSLCLSDFKNISICKKNIIKKQPIKADYIDDLLCIDIYLNVKYNVKIHEISPLIQSSIIDSVYSMTSLTVKSVNLNFESIDLK